MKNNTEKQYWLIAIQKTNGMGYWLSIKSIKTYIDQLSDKDILF